MAREPGSQIGPFTIQSLLGAGGMGEVYRVRGRPGMRPHPDGKRVVFTSGEVTTTFWLVDGVTAALRR